MKTGCKAHVTSLAILFVSTLLVGAAGAATIGQWLFDEGMENYVAINSVPGGDQPNMITLPASTYTNLHEGGGPFPQSFGMMNMQPELSVSNVALRTTTFAVDWTTKTNLTIEMWVKPSNSNSTVDPINYRGQIMRMTYSAGRYVLAGYIYGSSPPAYSQTTNGTASIAVGSWSHIALTYDGAALKTYVNGVLDSILATNALPLTNSGNLNIGRGSSSGYFHGYIDEVRVSDVALPAGDGSGSNCLAWNKSLAIPTPKGAGYTDGAKINLSVVDGAVATNTATVWNYAGALAGAINAQYHGYKMYAGYYGQSGIGVPVAPANPGYWTLQLPQPYHVSHYSLAWTWGGGYLASNFVVQTSDDGALWTDRASTNGNTNTTTAGDFPDVVAKYIRVKITSVGGGSGDLWILQAARFTGNNGATVDRRVSVADANWAGASITGSWASVGQAIDDTVNQALVYVNAADASSYPLIVRLNGQYKVDRIGIAPFSEDNRAARNIDVYTCADYGGNTNWVLVKQIRDLAYTNSAGIRWPYLQYDLDTATTAARVKFQVLTNWGSATSTYLGQLFVFPWTPPRGTIFIIH